jgi:hypothetical protein
MKYFILRITLAIIVACTFLAKLEVQEEIFGSHMRNIDMEDFQGSYIDEEEIKGPYVKMGKTETKSNGIRSKVEPVELVVTMKSL